MPQPAHLEAVGASVNGRRAAILVAAAVLLVLAIGAGRGVSAAGSATAVSHGPRGQHVVALTFDDGVSPDNCRRILATLVAEGVPATFFPIAEAMQLDPSFWGLVAQAGDPVGDHTMTHPQMPQLGYGAQLAQLSRSRTLVESTIGRPMLRVFRPPYGAYDSTTLAAAAAAGFPTALLWDTSDRDTSPHGALADMLAAGERGTNGSVVLLHCGPNATPYLLADLIASYRGRGFGFVTVPQLLGISWRPGSTRPVSPDEILAGLAPLPPTSSGGIIVGASGWTPPPSVAPRSGGASAAPTASAPSVPSAAPPISSLPPSATAVGSPVGDAAGATPASTAGPPASPGQPGPSGAVLGLVGLAIVAGLVMLAVARLRRR